jgi:CHASE2 domain-containing sensor protein
MAIDKNWAEVLIIVVLALGFILAITSKTAAVIYAIALLAGFFLGRVIYETRKGPTIPVALISAGFVVGYLIGTIYGNRMVVLLLFATGMFLGYLLHER